MDKKIENIEENTNKIQKFIKNNYKFLLALFFGIYVLYWMMFLFTKSVGLTEKDTNKIDSLNALINKTNQNQEMLNSKIDEVNKEIGEIDKNINNIKNQKIIIREKYHEKINHASNFTEPELDSFFSSRYK